MNSRSPKIILISLAALLALFLGFRFGRDLFDPQRQQTQAVADVTPILASDGGVISGARDFASEPPQVKTVFHRVAWTVAPFITAHEALIADPETGEVLFTFNAGSRWSIASLAKLMSAEIIKDQVDLSKNVTLAAADFAGGGNNLTVALQPGSTYRGEDLLKVMLTSSSNEAAAAFARVYGKTAFIAAMNAQAAAWGLKDTSFSDPSGLAAADQSTANDYKDLAIHVWQNHPELFQITRSKANSVVEQNSGLTQTFQSTNEFAGRADFLGGKTGTTPEAGENLLSFFSYRSHPVMILLFGSADRFRETNALLQWFNHDFSPSN
jgi:D-alanyl-D-alanine carboxypeptidase (penicillin-binding protein 5/6)